MSACTNHKILFSVKQATAAHFFGCSVELLPDAANPGKVVFRATPRELAEEAIQVFEGGELLPARALLDAYASMYREVRAFLKQYQRVGKGEEIIPAIRLNSPDGKIERRHPWP